jgi:hypothetical protein
MINKIYVGYIVFDLIWEPYCVELVSIAFASVVNEWMQLHLNLKLILLFINSYNKFAIHITHKLQVVCNLQVSGLLFNWTAKLMQLVTKQWPV